MKIIKAISIEELKKQIKNAEKPIIVETSNNELSRKVLENNLCNILILAETNTINNNLRQIDSGLNEILGRIAEKNNISIGINLDQITILTKNKKAEKISKIIQNIKICKKTKTKIKILNYTDKNATLCLLRKLGASSKQASEAILF